MGWSVPLHPAVATDAGTVGALQGEGDPTSSLIADSAVVSSAFSAVSPLSEGQVGGASLDQPSSLLFVSVIFATCLSSSLW